MIGLFKNMTRIIRLIFCYCDSLWCWAEVTFALPKFCKIFLVQVQYFEIPSEDQTYCSIVCTFSSLAIALRRDTQLINSFSCHFLNNYTTTFGCYTRFIVCLYRHKFYLKRKRIEIK